MQSVFSPSSLNCFENCPRQYAFRYIEKIQIESEGIEAFVGKRVHEVLERLYQFVEQRMLPSLPKVIARYAANFDEQFDAARVRIVREGTPVEFYRDAGVRGLENYYKRHYPFDRDRTVGLERPIQFALDEDGKYAVRGIIDRIARAQDGVLEIHDFKTGRRVPPQDDLDRDRQLGLYELGIREQFGESGDMRLVWHYVLRDVQRTSQRTPEQREQLRASTARAIDKIRAEREFAPRPSGLCGWCEFRDRCPAVNPARAAELAALAPEAEPDPQLSLL
ncbi:MAG TPA: PD-(D/E)XK nuclease family protein [Myxococcota bacterium]